MNDDHDALLKAMLAAPERAPDEAFVARMREAVLLEQRMRASMQAAWSRFAVEMAATACAILAFILLARMTPASASREIPLFSPAAMGLLLLALWVGVTLRPSGSRS